MCAQENKNMSLRLHSDEIHPSLVAASQFPAKKSIWCYSNDTLLATLTPIFLWMSLLISHIGIRQSITMFGYDFSYCKTHQSIIEPWMSDWNEIWAHLAQKNSEVSRTFPENFFMNVVKMSKEMCNLGSFVLFTLLTNKTKLFAILYSKSLKRKCPISITK